MPWNPVKYVNYIDVEFTVLPKISEIFPKTIGFFHISRIELKVRRPKDVQRLKRDDAVVAWQFRWDFMGIHGILWWFSKDLTNKNDQTTGMLKGVSLSVFNIPLEAMAHRNRS